MYTTGSSTLCCHWCKIPLGNTTKVIYLNGNLPVCDLCLIKAQSNTPILKEWNTPEEDRAWEGL